MPPNQKYNSFNDAEGGAASLLNIPVRSEFLPLTHPKEASQQRRRQQQQHEQQEEEQQQQQREPQCTQSEEIDHDDGVVNYWDWTSDAALGEEEKKEEEIADLFSLSRIESNLISDSLRTNKGEPSSSNNNNNEEEESSSYWAWSQTECNKDDLALVESESASEDEVEVYGQQPCEDYWAWESEAMIPPCDDEDEGSAKVPPPVSREEETADAATNNSNINSSIVINHSLRRQRKQHYRGRRHSLLDDETPDPTTEPEYHSDHYWHWSESKFESYRNKRKEQVEQRQRSIAMSAYF